MRELITVLSICAFIGAAAGCSAEHESRTTTHESVQAVPADPVVIEKRTTIETHTED